jgi:hypothetical protein
MPQPPTNDRSEPSEKTLSSGAIEVVFSWRQDRWHHAVHLRRTDGSRAASCLEMAPAAATDDPQWPSSPPLVELAEMTLPQGPALLGVGLAGKSHYSVSITAEPEGTLLFEFACRLATPAGWLGSTYVMGENGASLPILIEPVGSAAVLRGTTEPDWPHGSRMLQIVPGSTDDNREESRQKGSTVQWGYRLRIAQTA